MQDNEVLQKYGRVSCWTDERIWRAVEEIGVETGFRAGGEIQRRFIFDRDKTWRLRIEGMLHGERASLRLEWLKLDTDEEDIRRAFRAQASGSRVRPPRTFIHRPFDTSRGYAYSIDEYVDAPPLFQPEASPEISTAVFVPFYRELRRNVQRPFWPPPAMDAPEFSADQFAKWQNLARERSPGLLDRHANILARLETSVIAKLSTRPLEFRHAHLAGGDIRALADETYVIFANYFWSWRQPGYDLAFAIWNQWMALPPERRSAEGTREVTESWLAAVRSSLADLVDEQDVRTMLLNRCFGSLILDIPAKRERHTEDEMASWETSIASEAERLVA